MVLYHHRCSRFGTFIVTHHGVLLLKLPGLCLHTRLRCVVWDATSGADLLCMKISHHTGGWYFEWAGWEQHSAHPAWLHPNALVLRAAFETLAAERAEAAGAAAGGGGTRDVAAQPRQLAGLWARLRSRLAGC